MWKRSYQSNRYRTVFNYILDNQPTITKNEVIHVTSKMLNCTPSNVYYLLRKLEKANIIEFVDIFVKPTKQSLELMELSTKLEQHEND